MCITYYFNGNWSLTVHEEEMQIREEDSFGVNGLKERNSEKTEWGDFLKKEIVVMVN